MSEISKTERFHFIFLALFLLLSIVFFPEGNLHKFTTSMLFLGLTSLAGFYMNAIRLQSSAMVLFVLFILFSIYFIVQYGITDKKTAELVYGISYAISGIFLSIRVIKEIIKNKEFEIFGTFLVLLLLFPFLNSVFIFPPELFKLYHFILALLILTIYYNENLWYKFLLGERKILLLLLSFESVIVIQASAENLGI